MSNELQSLWQSQEVPPAPLSPEGAGEGKDFAVPTKQFPERRFFGTGPLWFAVAALLFATFAWWLMRPMVHAVNPAPPPVVPANAEEVEDLITACRTYTSMESGGPDWERAELACRSVMALDPVHHEATTLLSRIGTMRTCESNLNLGLEGSSRPDEALDSLARVTKDCEVYFVRANAYARDLLPAALERASSACGADAGAGCQRWVNLECQRTGLTDKRVSAWSAAHPEWSCPGWFALRAPVARPDPRDEARALLRQRFADAALGEVLVTYFNGDPHGAVARVDTLNSPEALALKEDFRLVARLMVEFAAELQRGSVPRVDRAARVTRELLDADARLMLGADAAGLARDDRRRALERLESFVRRDVIRTLTTAAFEQGKQLAERRDFRAACRVWKMGADFSRADLDLLKALTNVCTRKAAAAFDDATTCEQFDAVLDLAVDGDGYQQRIEVEQTRLGCR